MIFHAHTLYFIERAAWRQGCMCVPMIAVVCEPRDLCARGPVGRGDCASSSYLVLVGVLSAVAALVKFEYSLGSECGLWCAK